MADGQTITENDIQQEPQAPATALAAPQKITDADIVDNAPAAAPVAPAAPQQTQEQIDKPAVTGLGPTAKAMGAGIYHFITDLLDAADYGAPIYDPKNPHGPPIGKKNTPIYGDPERVLDPTYHGEPNSLWNKYVASPLIEEGRKADALSGIDDPKAQVSSMGHRIASWIPFLGPLAAQSGEQLGARDIGGGALTGAAALFGARSAKPDTESLAKMAPDKAATVRASNAMLEKSSSTAKADLATAQANVGKRIGELVKDISDTDMDETSSRGTMGSISLAPAFDALVGGLRQFGATFQKTPNVAAVEELLEGAGKDARLPWESIKDIRSAVGQLMYRAGEGTKERGVIGNVYKQLTEQMSARADQLGKPDEFSAYNGLHSTMMDYLHDGVLGDVLNAKNGLDFFKELKKPSNAPELTRLNADLGKFGLADNFFIDLAKSHKETYTLAQLAESGGNTGMVGKFKAVGRRPIPATAAFIGVQALPLPGKLLWSIMAAAKAAELADRVKAASEIRKLGGTPELTGKFGKSADVMPSGRPTPFKAADEE